ncbi:MFS transporter [Listeria newyorkensis]|uniref:MFS transporter n=1 Tax=Listeria newyorkensis TaxID=1497681 RepID=A0ABX4XII7_9LIST|nr:MFS transporter [Listeria newyorkensis]KGL45664.1 MFS transporter [Listeria newyorkensis]PNP88253.1 MFS transporter [Listeria newyorkensis]WAO20749.2 MFS transporter [Listeria newyorkensis]SQC55185.1 L-galactonate transporter [Listeria newyorkensis]
MLKSRWSKFAVLYFGAVAVSLSQLKVVPVMKQLATETGMPVSDISWLMSIFTISGIFLAIPGATLLTKFGAKQLAVVLMGCLALGNVMGALTSNFTLLLISRAVEGVAFSMIIMVGIVLINYWFPEEKAGTPIGAFGIFSAVGSLIGMNVTLPIVEQLGLKSVWWILAGIALLAVVLFQLLLDGPPKESAAARKAGNVSLMEALRNGRTWLLALAQGCMAFVLFTFITIYPQLFTDFYGLSTESANFYASLFGLFGIPFGVMAGYLVDRTGKPELLTFVSYILLTLSCITTTFLNSGWYVVQLFVLSGSVGLVSCIIMIMASRFVKRKALIGYSVSFINMIYYIGIVVGAPLVLKIIEKSGWQAGMNLLSIAAGIGTVSIFVLLLMRQPERASQKLMEGEK